MKIFGIGTDIVNIKRMEKIFIKKNNNFKNRIFSKREILYCENKKKSYSYYAKRFAAKEALSKALGTGIRKGINFKDIEILNDKMGKPYINLKGSTKNFWWECSKGHEWNTRVQYRTRKNGTNCPDCYRLSLNK